MSLGHVHKFNSLVEVGRSLSCGLNHEQQEADLIPLRGESSVEEIVSFSELEAYSENRPLKSASGIQQPIATQRWPRSSDPER
jgi:hypothetical protein